MTQELRKISARMPDLRSLPLVLATLAVVLIAVPSVTRAQIQDDSEEPDLIWIDEEDTPEENLEPDKPTLRDRLDELPFDLNGFAELRGSWRTRDDPDSGSTVLSELRFNAEVAKGLGPTELRIRADLVWDQDLEEFDLDLREASLLWVPQPWLDLKIGRQVITWGIGDLLFINDLFPKDWQSFLSGREISYLKAPSDAIKATANGAWGQVNLVWTPGFDPDRYLTGERLSFFDPSIGGRRGELNPILTTEPDNWVDDGEIALRAVTYRGSWELAVYAYDGFWKSPSGIDGATGHYIFPELRVFGASVQGPVLGGMAAIEVGRYDSRDDPDGSNPFVDNGQDRFLIGWSRDLGGDLSLGVQYYLEATHDYDTLVAHLPPGLAAPEENWHIVTVRLTHRALHQNLTSSLFVIASPSDDDLYVLPSVSYRLKDQWTLSAGANLFFGEGETTFWRQFQPNDNAWVGVRWSF